MYNLTTFLLYWTINKQDDQIHSNNDCPTLGKISQVLTSARTSTMFHSAVIWGQAWGFWCNLSNFWLLYIIWWSVGGIIPFPFTLKSDIQRWVQTVSPNSLVAWISQRLSGTQIKSNANSIACQNGHHKNDHGLENYLYQIEVPLLAINYLHVNACNVIPFSN